MNMVARIRELSTPPKDDHDRAVLLLCDQYEALLQQGEPEGWKPDYFSFLVVKARAAAHKACKKFPQPNYVLLKVSEEAGEVVRAGVHYIEKRMPWEEVEGEIVQLLAMVFRLVTEGDQVNGLTPPPEISSSASPLPPAPGAETGAKEPSDFRTAANWLRSAAEWLERDGYPFVNSANECIEQALKILEPALPRSSSRQAVLEEAGTALADAAGDIHPTAPSSAAIEKLHAAIAAWFVALNATTPPAGERK